MTNSQQNTYTKSIGVKLGSMDMRIQSILNIRSNVVEFLS